MATRAFSKRSGCRASRRRTAIPGAFGLAITFGLIPWPAQAYIDPGSASIVLQAIVGGLAAAAFALKLYWQRVKRLLRFKPKNVKKENGRADG